MATKICKVVQLTLFEEMMEILSVSLEPYWLTDAIFHALIK